MSNSHLFLKSAFITTPGQNGVGRYICQLQRVVFKFCKNHGASRGLREFIESGLMKYVTESPEVAVYLKPRRHRSPIIKAEYLNGESQWICVHDFTQEEILKWLKLIKSQSTDRSGIRLRRLLHTDHPSIQGPWTPYTFRDPKLNLATFPNTDIGRVDVPGKCQKTASEQMLELFEKQSLKDLETQRAE